MDLTTRECLNAARELLSQAKRVTTRAQHKEFHEKETALLDVINSTLETGYFTGRAYDELHEARNLLLTAEAVAVDRARETYTRQ